MRLKELLVSKGIHPTQQRMKILQYLQRPGRHPTADDIYRDLVKEMPAMSKTTVYNTVHTFLEKGIVTGIMITGTEVRFDAETGAHHHFLCESCGRILDLNVTCPNCAREEIAGHRIKELHGYFKGVCASCRKKENT